MSSFEGIYQVRQDVNKIGSFECGSRDLRRGLLLLIGIWSAVNKSGLTINGTITYGVMGWLEGILAASIGYGHVGEFCHQIVRITVVV